MTHSNPEPTFNLWSEAWITLERSDGLPISAGIEQTLLEAHRFTAIYDLSPLAVVGIHRLLVAILQASLNPQKLSFLRSAWQNGQFPVERIKDFGRKYAERFDIFSKDKPFMQSGDLPLAPIKNDKSKTVAYLTAETSPLTAIDHYRHGFESSEYFCPSCLAVGLLTIPPFTGIGGRGYKPSINGTPPLYVLPVGRNLFESLALSLLLPTENYWPSAASRNHDLPWWEHPPVVEHSKELIEVGYLHSLTFPARRVRLHPVKLGAVCTRCGETSAWGVRTMIFEMGEYRPKDSAPWMDPFVAYRLPDEDRIGNPMALLPFSGKAIWREFAGLFLYLGEKGKKRVRRPAILERIANQVDYAEGKPEFNFRCIGVQVSQAKVLEWMDASFSVPSSLLNDPNVTYLVREAIQFSEDCANLMAGVFRSSVNPSRRGDRNKALKDQMLNRYWMALAYPFRAFIMSLVEKDNQPKAVESWAFTVAHQAQAAFDDAIAQVGDDGISLRQQVEGEQNCHIRLEKKRKKYLNQGAIL
ncbi:MAG: type I-E CRISPR-associated protein Cse1/CasA [Anaerolineaceae bacterium]|jgi:CRISPR system Cascade subunit CasA